MTALDTLYFTRGGFDVHIEIEDFEQYEQYSTSHDYKLSKIMANEKFQHSGWAPFQKKAYWTCLARQVWIIFYNGWATFR